MNKRPSVATRKHKPSPRIRISLIVDAKLRAALDAMAAREKRTLNAQCEVVLARAIEEDANKIG